MLISISTKKYHIDSYRHRSLSRGRSRWRGRLGDLIELRRRPDLSTRLDPDEVVRGFEANHHLNGTDQDGDHLEPNVKNNQLLSDKLEERKMKLKRATDGIRLHDLDCCYPMAHHSSRRCFSFRLQRNKKQNFFSVWLILIARSQKWKEVDARRHFPRYAWMCVCVCVWMCACGCACVSQCLWASERERERKLCYRKREADKKERKRKKEMNWIKCKTMRKKQNQNETFKRVKRRRA